MRVHRRLVIAAVVVLGLAALLAFAAPAKAAYAPGERIWVKSASTGPLGDAFYDLAGGPNGSVFAAGIGRATEESSRLLVARYGAGGDRLWYHSYAGPGTGGLAEEAAVSDRGWLYVACTKGTWVLPRSQDIVVARYAKDGTRVATRVFDGPAHRQDYAADIAVYGWDTVYVAGTVTRSGTGKDIALIKLRRNGEIVWTRYYAGPGKTDEAHAVAVDAGGNAYVVGKSGGDSQAAVVVKISRGGHVLWSRRLHGGAGPADATDVGVISGAGISGVYVTGSSIGGMSTKAGMLCAKLGTSTGAVKWQTTAEVADGDDYGYALGLDAAGNVVVAGETVAFGTAVSRGLVAKWGPSGGAPTYQNTYQVGLPGDDASFAAIAVDADGNAYCGGYTSGSTHAEDYTIAAFAPNGSDLWGNVFTSTGVDADFCRDVLVRKDGVYGAGSVTPGDGTPLPGNMNQNALLIKHQR